MLSPQTDLLIYNAQIIAGTDSRLLMMIISPVLF